MIKRAMLSIFRNPKRTIVLFFIVLLLAIFTSGSLSIAQGIVNTRRNLQLQLPPIAMLSLDIGMLTQKRDQGGSVDTKPMTPTIIREVGILPQVVMYDFSLAGLPFYSDRLIRVFKEDLMPEGYHDIWSLAYMLGTNFERFTRKNITSLPTGTLLKQWDFVMK